MASITLRVIINDLDNSDLSGYADSFERWLRQATKKVDGPTGHVDEVTEDNREEDENGETED
jgi:hypothetical protein